MKKILNGLFYFLKFLLFFASFSLSLFIIVQMYQRLGKNITESAKVFLPYFVIIILFIINLFAKQKSVTQNIFYNITCTLVFATILVVGLRAMFDSNMVLRQQLGRNINFNFFDYFIPFMKIMLYGLSISNIFLMFSVKTKKKKVEVTSEKVEVIAEQVI